MRKKSVVRAVAALAGGCVLGVSGVAGAAQTCTAGAATIGDANTVYINGSSAVKQLLQHLAYVLYTEGVAAQGDASPVDMSKIVKIVYQGSASCEGLNDVLNSTSDPFAGTYMDPTTGTTANPIASAVGCTISPTATWNVDIGASDVYPNTCTGEGNTLTAPLYDFNQGSIQVMEIATNAQGGTLSQPSISAEAAYVVFGFGGMTTTVGPWTDHTQIFIRGNGTNAGGALSGTLGMIASAIGLLPSKWSTNAQAETGSGGVLSGLQGSTDAKASIGILSASNVDPNKGPPVLNDASAITSGGISPLAFQAKGQTCGYYPDSTLSGVDKINVRQGRYVLWGAHHWITNTTASDGGTPTPKGVNGNDAAVQSVIEHLMHESTLSAQADQAMIAAEAQTFDVPSCAMQAKRSGEVTQDTTAGEMSYLPPKGCGCYFESVVNKGAAISSYCTQTPSGGCTADSACPSAYPKCNYGFCEVQ